MLWQGCRHLKDVKDRNCILKGVGQIELLDVGLLSIKVQHVLPLFHHLLGIQPWTRYRKSGNVNGSFQLTIQVNRVNE